MLRTRKIICGVSAFPWNLRGREYHSASNVQAGFYDQRRIETLAFLISIQEMSQIETEVLQQGTRSKKVISASFFRMKQGYRDFSK